MPTSWASQVKRKNFQNSRPTFFLEQLKPEPVDRLDHGAPVCEPAQLAPNAAHVHVNVPIMICERPPESAPRELVLAHRSTDVAQEHFEQTEFGAGEIERYPLPFDSSLLRPHGEAAGGDTAHCCIRGRHRRRTAQYRADARDQLARCARLRHVIVGAELQPRDAIHIVAACGEHEHGKRALFPDASQHLEPIDLRHHDIEHCEVILTRKRGTDPAAALAFDMHREPLRLEILTQQRREFRIIRGNSFFRALDNFSAANSERVLWFRYM